MRGSPRASSRVPVLYKISTVVDRDIVFRIAVVPVLYKISTVVDFRKGEDGDGVPVLYKISTVVDRAEKNERAHSSRSLQNFYCCRSFQVVNKTKGFPFFTKFLLL